MSGHWRCQGAASSRLARAWRTARAGRGGGGETARPGEAGPSRAELESHLHGHRSPNSCRGSATMRWIRALLKNASLAGAPKYIEHFSKFSPSPLSMKQFLDFGTEWAGGGWTPDPAGAWVGRM